MSLFDLTQDPDARAGLLAAGLAMLGARNGHVLQDFGQAGLLGLQASQNSARLRQQQQQAALQQQVTQLQLEQMRRQMAQQQALQGAIRAAYGGGATPGAPTTPMDAAMAQAPSLAPTNANVAAVTQAAQKMTPTDPQDALYQQMLARANAIASAGGQAGSIQAIQMADAERKAAMAYAPKRSSVITEMVNGEPRSIQTFANRAPQVLDGMLPMPNYKAFNNGTTSGFIDPLTQKLGPTWAMNMTPAESAQNQVALGQLGVARTNAATNQARVGVEAQGNAIRQQGINLQAAIANAPQVVKDVNGNPYLFQKLSQATKPLPGPNGGPQPPKTLDATQAKTQEFADQMIQASNKLSQLDKAGYNASTLFGQIGNSLADAKGGMMAPLKHFMAPHKSEEYVQAENQWLQALAYHQSGAQANPGELEDMRRQYFPIPGNSAAVVRQKAAARHAIEQNLMHSAGPTATFTPYSSGKVIDYSDLTGNK